MGENMNLNKFDLTVWERDELDRFNKDDSLEDLLNMVNEGMKQDFLNTLADSLLTYRKSKV